MLQQTMMMQKTNQARAMMGTSLVEKTAILLRPPKMMMAAARAIMAPKMIVPCSSPRYWLKALSSAVAEFVAWTPTNPIPNVMMMRTARRTARGRLPTPLRA